MIRDKRILIIKLLVTFMLFIAAINYENALINRTLIYAFLFILYLISNIGRYFLKKEDTVLISFIIELFIIYLFEYYSRYQVNYIFHIFYFLMLLEIPIYFNNKKSIIFSLITLIISNIKFINLIYLKPSFGSISQGGFFLFTGIFLALLMNFLKYYKVEEEKKRLLNKELMEANIRLNEMTIIEERNRIARDLHDTIGHGLTGTIMSLEIVQVLIDEDIEKAKKMVIDLKESTRENLVNVREVVGTLNPNENISKGIESIKELIKSFTSKSNIKVNFEIEGIPVKTSPNSNIVIYRTIQEGLTNAIRHGKANLINIKLMYSHDSITLHIKDNGTGVEEILKGFGLRAMEDRVFSLGGNISFFSKDGFSILLNLPLEVQND
ncbi:sensor histidine kinase [Tissierella sp. Yu-01]|uniref:sensor histidine kinase n=1 Tax=Tissierella sp. Yu-01 TaxID=3035694 RepID=UPI00240D6870|nr:sensor histidine kinase [Tissierella sp. Yu-01]WFA08752.1 sensor histidine kinase [Tissierella sp. Yu-01]